MGYVVDGKLYCQLADAWVPHVLPADPPSAAPIRAAATHDHMHGPSCGHEMVPHGDHVDYLVGDELQHICSFAGGPCADAPCLGGASNAISSHGRIKVLRHRRNGTAAVADAAPLLDRMYTTPPANAHSITRDVECGGADQQGTPVSDETIETRIYAAGVCCPMEVPLVEKLLTPLPGVQKVDVAVVTQTVMVRHLAALTSPAALMAALNAAQLNASLIAPRDRPRTKGFWVPPQHLLLAALLLIISVFHYLSKRTGVAWLNELRWLAIGAAVVGGPPIVLRALASLRRWLLDINALMLIAVAGAIAIGDYTEGAAVVVLFSLAEWLEVRATGRARDAISAVLALKPDTAVLAATGEEVPVAELPVGETVLVRPGERIPADGLVTLGTSVADESMLTGEAAPVNKSPGDEALGGTLNAGDEPLEVLTTSSANDSTVAQLGRLVERAAAERSPLEGAVNRFAKYYTPLVLLTALLIAFVPWATSSDHRRWVYLSLQILVTACPCALVLSTPVAMVCAIAAAAKAGVLVRGSLSLEALGLARTVLFDKTGTLTSGNCKVVHLEPYGGHTEAEMLALAAAAERGSSHPLAAALVGAAAAARVSQGEAATNSVVAQGQGIVATVEGREIAVGNSRLLLARGITLNQNQIVADASWQSQGATVVWVATSEEVLGLAAIADEPRPGAADAVAALQRMGVRCAMITGDNAGAAASVGAEMGLSASDVHAGLLPSDKLALVHKFKKESKGAVAVVGDGINDAPALAAADVGIAMGARGAAAALEAAPVALFSEQLGAVPGVLRLGRATRRTIYLNIAVSVTTKAAVLVLAALGMFTLWGAVLVDVGAALAVIANSLLLLRRRLRPPRTAAHCVGEKAGGAAEEKQHCSSQDCGATAAAAAHAEAPPRHGGAAFTGHGSGAAASQAGAGCGEHAMLAAPAAKACCSKSRCTGVVAAA